MPEKDQKEKREGRVLRAHVPLHRAFAVRRYQPVIEKTKTYFVRVLGFVILGGLFGIASLAAIFFFLYFREVWIKLLVAILLALVLGLKVTKNIRKRRKFIRKLKRFCRKHFYSLTFKSGLLESFRWDDRKIDFVIKTPHTRYELYFLTVKKYRSVLSVESKDQILVKSVQLENRFTQIFDFEPKIRSYDTSHLRREDASSSVVRGIVVNPVCGEMNYRAKDGGLVATGNGAELFGYVLFTGSGLLEYIQRKEG